MDRERFGDESDVPHDFTKTRDGWALFMRAVPNPNIFLLIDQPERMDSVEINDIDDWRKQLGPAL